MNGIELNRLGMQRRILRNLSLRLDGYQQPLVDLITLELQDAVCAGGRTTGGTQFFLTETVYSWLMWEQIGKVSESSV